MYWIKKNSTKQTIGEEIANSISHGIMVPFSIFILIVYCCMDKTKDLHLLSLLCFPLTMLFLYLMSCLYHSLAFTKAKLTFKMFDHVCIYFLIWGSFIPFLFGIPSLNKESVFLGLTQGEIFFTFQTLIIFLGALFKILCLHKGTKIHLCLYLLLGWSAIFVLPDLFKTFQENPKILILLVLGGFFYTSGVFFYYHDEERKYYHFIWHLFVIMGNLCHVLAVYLFIN